MMSLFPSQIGSWGQHWAKWLTQKGLSLCLLGTSVGWALNAPAVQAADSLFLTFGPIAQKIEVKELETFANGGEMAPSFSYIVNLAQLDPEKVRSVLNQEFNVDFLTLSDILTSLPGEYLLFEVSRVFRYQYGQVQGPRSQRGNYRSLRSAILLSAYSDNTLSLLEFLQQYPNNGLYVDGVLLLKRAIAISEFIDRVETKLEVPLQLAKDLLEALEACECEASITAR